MVDISDHLPVFAVLPSHATKCKTKKTIYKQDFSAQNLDIFKNSLMACDWTILQDCQDVNSMYNTFISTTQTLYEKAFPFRTKTVSIAVNHRPWITPAIKKSINKKNLLYKSYVKHKTTESFNSYKAYRNKLASILRKAEKNYCAVKLENVKDNLAKTWKILT